MLLLDRAFLIRYARNKYCHQNKKQIVTEFDEMFDLLNIMLFINNLKIVLNDVPGFNDFENHLIHIYKILYNVNSNTHTDKEKKLDKIINQLSVLSKDIENIKNEKINTNDPQIDNEEFEKEIAQEIKNEELTRKNKKKYKILVKKSENKKYMEKFSSEDLESIDEESIIEIEDTNTGIKEEPYIVNVNKSALDLLREKIEKFREKANQNNNIIIPKTIENEKDRLLNWFNTTDSTQWKRMAGFAKANNLLYPNAKNMLYKMGVYIEKGWEPTINQLLYAERLYNEIIDDYNKYYKIL